MAVIDSLLRSLIWPLLVDRFRVSYMYFFQLNKTGVQLDPCWSPPRSKYHY